MGIRIHGTLFLLKLLLLLGITSVDDLKKYLYQMVKEGFRLSAEVIINFIADLEEEGKENT